MPIPPKRGGNNYEPSTPTQKKMTSHSEAPAALAARIAAIPQRHDNDNPLWAGPCGRGPLGGITQSMIARFLSCRERFRLKYILGLEPHPKWNHRLGYGNMWHVCEEALASESRHFGEVVGTTLWTSDLCEHVIDTLKQYPLQREEIEKWYAVCRIQFPEYVRYWADHPDVTGRTPLLQEQVFDVPYTLPSGRCVRLRGKWDSVDLIDGGVYLQENKTKGDIDKLQVERQLKFDLQTMLYLTALHEQPSCDLPRLGYYRHRDGGEYPIMGVRYNVVRRPLSGGKGNISPHKAKATKTKFTPAESAESFYERLRRDYIAKEPDYWFFRVRAEISAVDIKVFRESCLDPLLEQICVWYEQLTGQWDSNNNPDAVVYGSDAIPPMNYRTPFGVYSALEENGATEYDAYMATGSVAGLRRIEELFPEL